MAQQLLLSAVIFKTKVSTHPSLWLLKPTGSSYQKGKPWRSDYASTDPPPGSNNDWLPRDTGRGSQQPCSPPDTAHKTDKLMLSSEALIMYSCANVSLWVPCRVFVQRPHPLVCPHPWRHKERRLSQIYWLLGIWMRWRGGCGCNYGCNGGV